jgi:hypothetical protein
VRGFIFSHMILNSDQHRSARRDPHAIYLEPLEARIDLIRKRCRVTVSFMWRRKSPVILAPVRAEKY